MSWSDRLYASLPDPLQHVAVRTCGVYWYYVCLGPGYRRHVLDYSERETFTHIQWKEWQSVQLQKLLSGCAHHVPYYREHWDEDCKRVALDGNLSALPLLDKDPLRAAPVSFLRDDMHPLNR